MQKFGRTARPRGFKVLEVEVKDGREAQTGKKGEFSRKTCLVGLKFLGQIRRRFAGSGRTSRELYLERGRFGPLRPFFASCFRCQDCTSFVSILP
jgi:hypothetical protein